MSTSIKLRADDAATLETFYVCVQHYVDAAKVRFYDFGYDTVRVQFSDTEEELNNFLSLVDDCEWISLDEEEPA